MMTAETVGHVGEESQSDSGKWWVVVLIIVLSGAVSAFYAINEYATKTGSVIKNASTGSDQFESVFRELMQARFRALNLASEVMLQSRVTVEAFAKQDRDSLTTRIEPFFQQLQKEHGIAQLNFWTAPATVFYRAGQPANFGQDLSKFRKSIIAANERKQKILAVETGLGGLVAFRAITPVLLEGKMIGVIEFVSDFNIPLERASTITGLNWALGLAKDVSDRVERPFDAKNDAVRGTDVFFRYSDAPTGEIIRALDFDPRSKGATTIKLGSRTVFVNNFHVVNFSGIPTIVITVVKELTDIFAEIFQQVAIKTGGLFLILAVGISLAYLKSGKIRANFTNMLYSQKKELEERAVACDAAMAKLKEVDVVKRGFFTNLVAALSEPLQAVSGQLQSLVPAVDALTQGRLPDPSLRQAMREGFDFALDETSRLSHLVSDYQQLELFRQRLVKADNPQLSIVEVIDRALAEDLADFQRLPQLTISSTVATDMPLVRADADLLRRAIAGLVGYAARRGGHGRITLSSRHERDSGWLTLFITGSAFAAAGTPTEALIDESRQFLARIDTPPTQLSNAAPLVAVVLSRIIFEFYGGSLGITIDQPGFIARLPVTS
ncbi:MAG: hypothetical protein HQL58_09435 [Magnetococcales bacterium]|nr:hypothetical protein [Magnetococcales bacterium]